MGQGSYKLLLFKLSGAAISLVAMLFVATLMGQNFTQQKKNHGKQKLSENLDLNFAFNQDFNIVAETVPSAADKVLNKAKQIKVTLIMKNMAGMIRAKSHMVETLNHMIEKIAKQRTIPADIKATMVADLAQELKSNEKNIEEIARKMEQFSFELTLSHFKATSPLKATNVSVCPKKDALGEKNKTKGVQKNSSAAFYWI